MVAKGVFVALAFLAMADRGLSLSCVPCNEYDCGPTPTCSHGLVKAVCYCCDECAKRPGEKCGGTWGFSGKCSVGYECLPFDYWTPGTCVAKNVTTPMVPATTEFETTPIVPTTEESVTTFPWTCGKYAWQKCAGYSTRQPPPLTVKPTLLCHLGICPPIGESGVTVVDSPVIPGEGLSSPRPPPLRLTPRPPGLKTPPPPPFRPITTPVFAIACQNNDECPFDNPCVNKLCLDSCHPGRCGENADCLITELRLSCVCPSGTTGNPTIKCTALKTEEHTTLPPIGESGVTVVDSPVIPGKRLSSPRLPPLRITTPSPPPKIRPGRPPFIPQVAIACQNNDECPFDNPCVSKRCLDSCHPGRCGENADCVTTDHRPVCTCPPGITGNPMIKCTPLDTEEHAAFIPPIWEPAVPVPETPIIP